MPAPKPRKKRPASKKPAPRAVPPPPRPVKPAPPPLKRFFVRCTFVGEMQKRKVDGSFRFLIEASDVAAVRPKLEPAVKKLRRGGELPSRCDVYVEFVLELADLPRGVVVDFERWERDPKRFEHGCMAFSDTCAVYDHGAAEPAFSFGKKPEAAPAPALAAPPA